MKLALGWKAHSGWAVLIAAGSQRGELMIADRRRVELIDEPWQKQPYHAAEHLEPAKARALVERGVSAVHQIALREMQSSIAREAARKHQIIACAVVAGKPMPPWGTDEILSVHIRMHKAEGVLYQHALIDAAGHCGLPAYEVTSDLLEQEAGAGAIEEQLARLGKELGPPWGMDQKDAARAAYIALRRH